MEKRNLEVIKFHISPRGDAKDQLDMSDIQGIDLLDDSFKNFVSFIDNYPKDDKKKQVVKIPKGEDGKASFKKKNNYRTITGIIETGKYGKNQKVYDSNDVNGKPVFEITKDQSVPRPFFFLICISDLKKDGLIILERDGSLGIKYVFSKIWRDFIKSRTEKTFIHYTNFIDKEVVNQFIKKGSFNEINLTRHSLPQDIADRYGLDRLEKDNYVLELTLRTKKGNTIIGKSRKRILKMFEKDIKGFFTSQELKDVGFDNKSTLKVKSTYKNSTRKIDLSDTMKFKPYYEIDVKINSDGHSEYESIEKKALELLDGFSLDLYNK
jgi:hypothetical protein